MTAVTAVYGLSPTQEAMLAASLQCGDTALYVEQVDCLLQGDLQLSHFEQAWQTVVNRHDTCRTAFAWRKTEKPVQVVGPSVRLPIDVQDWRSISSEEQEGRFRTYLESERRRGFDLSKAPLMRLGLLRVAKESYRFVWTHHHLILDGWSISPLLLDFWTIYESLCAGRSAFLPEPTPYRRYIEWLEQRDPADSERFWKHRLENVPTPFRLSPAAGGGAQSHDGVGDFTKGIASSLMQSIEGFARDLHVTPNICFQAAYAILLQGRTRDRDVVFGTTVSGRPPQLRGYESMVGVFINTIPVRMQIPSEVKLTEWLQAEQRTFTEQLAFSTSSLSDIHLWSGLPLHAPLFDSIFVFQNYPLNAGAVGQRAGLTIANIKPLVRTKYSLTVLAVRDAGLRLHFAFDQSRFDLSEIKSMAHQFESILEAMAKTPQLPVSALSDLTLSSADPLDSDPSATSPPAQSQWAPAGPEPIAIEPASILDLMLAIWKNTLRTDMIGPDDHFFVIGFNSLAATLLVARIRDAFHAPLNIADLFQAPTPRAISVRVRDAIETGAFLNSTPVVVPRKPLMPASFAQQRIWLAEKLNQDPDAFNMPLGLRLEGQLDLTAFASAIASLVQRHEILRTSLTEIDGIPMQTIADSAQIRPHIVDVSMLSTEGARKVADDLVLRHAMPFNLAQGPLMRIALIRHAPLSHTMLLSMHHIVGDLWSFGVLTRDLFAIYDHLASGVPIALPSLRIQYADYAAWESQLDEAHAFELQLIWWRERLEGLQPLVLPVKTIAEPVRIHGATYRFEIPAGVAAGIRETTRRNETTLFLTLLAAFALCIRRVSGQDDFALATNVSGRSDSWSEPLIGYFVNHILLRIRINALETFERLLAQVRESAVQAYARQSIPFERIAHVVRSSWKSVANLPQVLFVLQQPPRLESPSASISVTLADTDYDSSRLDLALFLAESPGGALNGYWTYNSNLYEETFVSAFSDHYIRLLGAIVAEQHDSIVQLEALVDLRRRHSRRDRSNLAFRPREGNVSLKAGCDVV